MKKDYRVWKSGKPKNVSHFSTPQQLRYTYYFFLDSNKPGGKGSRDIQSASCLILGKDVRRTARGLPLAEGNHFTPQQSCEVSDPPVLRTSPFWGGLMCRGVLTPLARRSPLKAAGGSLLPKTTNVERKKRIRKRNQWCFSFRVLLPRSRASRNPFIDNN